MKTGRTLVELAEEICRQNQAKKDFLLDTRALEMTIAGSEPVLEMKNGSQWSDSMKINEIAHRQIGTHLGIPAKYYDKMLTEYPELLTSNVNSWFKKDPATRMLRTLDGNARAFLSERYRRIDNIQIAEAVLPIIQEMKEATVESCEITETRMYMKVVNKRLQTEVTPGDIVQAGLVIMNSEVGFSSVAIQPLVYRLVCKNGMVVNDASMRKYHVGRGNEANENYELFTNETLQADDKAFMMKVQDTVRAVVDETKFLRVVDMMKEAKEAKIIGKDIPAVVELTSKEYRLSKDENDGVLSHLIRNGDLSLYGLSNAVTEHSQEVNSYDRATDLESIWFDIMTMSRTLWNRINAEV